MLTAEEIASITIFAGLSVDACDRLARVAADIRLAPGEFAVHAQDKRALFAVLEGRLETVNTVDGILRVVGGRGPGELVGEVPIALGTAFPFGFRAVEPTRLMRLEAEDYHAMSPRRPRSANNSECSRASGSGLAGNHRRPRRRARSWSASAGTRHHQLRRFLDRNQVTFRWITPDASDGELCGATPCRPTTTAGDPGGEREDGGAAPASTGGRAA